MSSAAPSQRRPLALRRIAALTAGALGAALLTTPGTATAQTDIDCSALGDNPMAGVIESALDTAMACDVEVRIQNRSWPYSTVYVTPQGQLHLVATADPVQEYEDQGAFDPTLEVSNGYLVPAHSFWQTWLRYDDQTDPLFLAESSYIDWVGATPVPTYSGTTAAYDELAPGLDLTVDVGAASAALRFDAEDAGAWDALTTGLVAADYDDVGLSVVDGALRDDVQSAHLFRGSAWSTPFTVRDAEGTVSPVELSVAPDGAVAMGLPDGVLGETVFPLALSFQWNYRAVPISEWGAATSAAPDLAALRGEAGLDAPYFEAAGESGDAVVGGYCDALTDPTCETSFESSAYWNFQWPWIERLRPSWRYDFTYPVASATFQVEAADGTTCVAPDLSLIEEFSPATTWNKRPAAVAAASTGACEGGTATYDVTGSVADEWADASTASRMSFGMTGSTETARFDGGSARLDVHFDIAGLYFAAFCSKDADNPDFYGTTQDYGNIYVGTWRSDVVDLGLTFNATFHDRATGEAVLTAGPHDVTLDGTSIHTLSAADTLDDGRYEVLHHLSSTAVDLSHTSASCHMGVDTSFPDIVNIAVEPGPHYIGDTFSIEVTVADEGFPDGTSDLSVWLHRSEDLAVLDEVVLRSDTTTVFETELTGASNSFLIQVEDQVPNETIGEPISIPATYDHHDLNQDGFQDLVAVRKSDGNLMFYAGKGDGTFQSEVSKGAGWDSMEIAMAGDLTGDGLADLLTRDTRSGYLYTYPGRGDGGFSASARILSGTGWNTMGSFASAGDFDQDGNLDVLGIRKSNGKLYLFRGSGDGTFASGTEVAVGWSTVDALTTLGDLDRDGNYDVLARDSGNGGYSVWFGDGNAGFERNASVDPALMDGDAARRFNQIAAVGDLSGDGYVDIAAVDSRTGEMVLRSFDELARELHDSQIVGPDWGSVRLPTPVRDRTYDYTGDNEGDVIARRSSDGNLYLYPNNGTNGLGSRILMGSGWGGMDLIETAGDLNGDDFPDLLARNTSEGALYVYPGDGHGGYVQSQRITIGTGWDAMNAIVAGHDYDGDGNVDLIAREASTGTLWLYPGTGTGTFAARQSLGIGWNPMREITAAGDLDHDGHADLLAVQNSNGCLYFYAGRGDGTFKARVSIGCGWAGYSALAGIGDFDGDGHTDWLARRDTDGTLYAYLGDGRGDYDFSRRITLGIGWNGMNPIA